MPAASVPTGLLGSPESFTKSVVEGRRRQDGSAFGRPGAPATPGGAGFGVAPVAIAEVTGEDATVIANLGRVLLEQAFLHVVTEIFRFVVAVIGTDLRQRIAVGIPVCEQDFVKCLATMTR